MICGISTIFNFDLMSNIIYCFDMKVLYFIESTTRITQCYYFQRYKKRKTKRRQAWLLELRNYNRIEVLGIRLQRENTLLPFTAPQPVSRNFWLLSKYDVVKFFKLINHCRILVELRTSNTSKQQMYDSTEKNFLRMRITHALVEIGEG